MFDPRAEARPESAVLDAMSRSIAHRGPDDEGSFLDVGIGLGARRLSIIDVEGGHQPIHNEDRSIWIVFNGEIYNYRKLRELLSKLGHHFFISVEWWVSVVVVGLTINVLSAYAKPFTDRLFSAMSSSS